MGQPTADQIAAEYQADFGRGPTDDEMRSEMDDANRYQWDTGPNGGLKAQIDKRAVNTPGGAPIAPGPSGVVVPARPNGQVMVSRPALAPGAPSQPDVYANPMGTPGFVYPTVAPTVAATQPANLNGLSLQQLMQLVSGLTTPGVAQRTGY